MSPLSSVPRYQVRGVVDVNMRPNQPHFSSSSRNFFAPCSLSVGGSGDQGFLESSFLGSDDDTSCILRH